MRLMCLPLLLLFMFFACTEKNTDNKEEIEAAIVQDAEIDSARKSAARAAAARIAASLDDRLLVGQVLISGIDGRGELFSDMKALLAECPTGGVMFFRYNLNTGNDAIRSLLGEAKALIEGESGIAPFCAVDHEGGKVNRFPPGVATLPAALTYWEMAGREGWEAAIRKVEEDSFNAGSEINGLGFNLNFAPVAEYLNAANSEFLESRSYGPDPVFAAEAAVSFVRGMGRAGILCVVKHFPSSAGVDPHRFPSVLDQDRESLDGLVSPFAALIRGGARAMMVSHTAVPAVDSENIASLSAKVMGEWLRHELGFEGIIISDDFLMAAAGGQAAASSPAAGTSRLSPEAAAIRSVAAGADMILVWPSNLRRTHRAFLTALEDGSLSRDRLREAASRVIFEKIRMGLIDENLQQ